MHLSRTGSTEAEIGRECHGLNPQKVARLFGGTPGSPRAQSTRHLGGWGVSDALEELRKLLDDS